jgi:hypothetical protein
MFSEHQSQHSKLSFTQKVQPQESLRFEEGGSQEIILDMESEQDTSQGDWVYQRKSEMPLSRPKTKSPFRSKSVKKQST